MTKKILIADDDHDLVRLLTLRSQALGLEVRTAHDALQALTAIEQEWPDIICLDVNMPRGNGMAVCEMISNDARLAGVPVIILTGCADREIVRRCHQLCAYYIPKSPDLWNHLEPLLHELIVSQPQRALMTGGASIDSEINRAALR